MSIEPEVPYDTSLPDEDPGTWRDPVILPDLNAMRISGYNDGISKSGFRESSQPDRIPDDYWILPPNVTVADILGHQRSRVDAIRARTNTYISFNDEKHQMDIWGEPSEIIKTKEFFNELIQTLPRHEDKKKQPSWGKAEKELTGKAKLKKERREAKKALEKSFQGLPIVPQPYISSFAIPDFSLPIPKLVGEKESFLNTIRAECKCYMWYEERLNIIRISGQNEEAVKKASARIRNWYLKCSRRPRPCSLRLVSQPSKNLMVSFRALPQGFMTYCYADPDTEKTMLEKQRLVEPIQTGHLRMLENLIELDDHQPKTKPENTLSESVATLDKHNREAIQRALDEGLESLRLFDWEIRLKVRFGQICLVDYPSKKRLFSIEELSGKIFPDPKFYSVLAPCIGKTRENMDRLFEYLSTNCEEYSDSPRTSFAIEALQYPTCASPPTSRRTDGPPKARGDPWRTTVTASFTSDGRVGLWNCLAECEDLVTISCVNLESEYSWETKLEYARRLPTEVNTPHSMFVSKLRLSAQNRLVLVSVPEYAPKIVTQKTKWVYGWGKYVVEVGRDEIWDISRVNRSDLALPLDLGMTEPHRVFYKVSLYKEEWRNRFSENLNLKIGEAPRWTTSDFLASETEDAHLLMEIAKQFANILTKEVPVYWAGNNNQASLF
ncbi:hypothetical protein J3Q64DRAFT_1722020 [Phycomyces blakesleeanus]|uniref:DUF7905 domain-containing protein n=2 Tax=Phycomyces blakesleeanus TaxID=4837 RepID=A0A167NVP7_PHYB8|nr:hypothetical protein PHYBLDRAFT_180197 [Phycomyces blakesleeanus NRRL 1555(-)]OAD76706.1 hypothetical protein PHYBLDRAFT_180197 [Phycomyces blakesleeanus NRRL 1555(-)]|eukprot:XP_018294746.1 hypothetical protein PHYBLDRAFT_180197 [Phycomyces blakesleeanus NRRL 1555(-)]